MKKIISFLFCFSAGLILCCGTLQAARKVSISFDKFHNHQDVVSYLKKIQNAYAGITDLMEIGKDASNRPIYVLVITNKNTGTTLDREKKLVYERKLEIPNPPVLDRDLGKPGYLLTGALHGDEKMGTEICLYCIDKLLSGYNEDSQITELINSKVFYVCPLINSSGVHKNTSKDGIDLNRNFPEGWLTGDIMPDKAPLYTDRMSGYRGEMHPAGEGDFPGSAPEAHALCEFVVTHPNLIMATDIHGAGNSVFRPMGIQQNYRMEKQDIAVYDEVMAPKCKEICQIEKWESASASGTDYHGLFIDWLYKQQGIYSILAKPYPADVESENNLADICEKYFQFELFRSSLMPQLKIGDIKVDKKQSGVTTILNITAEIENAGALPTALKNAEKLPMCRGDVVWLVGANNKLIFLSQNACQKIGVLDGTMSIPGFENHRNKVIVTWQVALDQSEAIKVVASSLKGGTVVKEVKF